VINEKLQPSVLRVAVSYHAVGFLRSFILWNLDAITAQYKTHGDDGAWYYSAESTAAAAAAAV